MPLVKLSSFCCPSEKTSLLALRLWVVTSSFCRPELGELMTMAKWMREFVATHPQYKQDSVLTDKINYDLFRKCDRIARGEEQCPELIGNPINKFK